MPLKFNGGFKALNSGINLSGGFTDAVTAAILSLTALKAKWYAPAFGFWVY